MITINNIRNSILSILFVFLSFVSVEPHSFRFDKININDGLSQNLVYSIFQDSKGFMWFGTRDGLNKYDGKSFKIYQKNPFDSTTISDNSILKIIEDKNGNLWIGTENGLNRFDPTTEEFQRFLYNESDTPKPIYSIKAICEMSDGSIFAGSKNGISRISFVKNKTGQTDYQKNYKIEKININDKEKNNIHFLLSAEKNSVWIGTNNGLIKLERRNNKSKTYFKKYTNESVYSLYRDRWGTIWAGGSGSIYSIVDEKLPIIKKYNLFKDSNENRTWVKIIRSIIEDNDGNLWLATQMGLLIFNKTTTEHYFVKNNPNDLFSIVSHSILTLYKDKGSVIWLGTSGKGISKYSEYAKSFNYYSCGYGEQKTQSIRTILLDGNNLWFCANEVNLFIMNRITQNISIPSFMKKNKISINDLFNDNNGNIWVLNSTKLIQYNKSRDESIEYTFKIPTIYKNPLLQKFIGLRKNILWIATSNSVSGFNLKTKQFSHYLYPMEESHSVKTAIIDSTNNFWIGTKKKLYRFNINNKKWKSFIHNYKDRNSISSNYVNSILLDPKFPNKYIWIGTNGAGLNKFDIENENFTLFSIENGLPNNVIYGILADSENKLWISTNNGLSHFDIEKGIFKNYNVFDGLQGNEFNTLSYYKSNTGEMFFGGIDGITYFFPNEIVNNPVIPDIVITEFLLFNKTISHKTQNSPLVKPISETKTIKLSYNQNNIGFKFASLNYTSPQNNKYSYKLINFDKEWVDASNEQIANYSHLPAGEYIFRVKGSNNDGIWNEEGTSIKLIITPPFWATWWAIIIYILLGIGIISLIIQHYKKRAELKKEIEIHNIEKEALKKINKLKSQFFAGISHEFRTPLTLILGPIYEMLDEVNNRKEKERLEIIRKNGERLIKLVNQLLDLSKSEAKKMSIHFDNGDIVKFIKNQIHSFQNFASAKGVKLSFISTEESINMDFDSNIFEKILSNLLSNALKFTQKNGEIFISVNKSKDDFLVVSVKDTGVGIPENELENIFESFYQIKKSDTSIDIGSGIGLALVKELVALHGGEITVSSEIEVGTTFIIKFPINNIALNNNSKFKDEIVDSNIEKKTVPFADKDSGETKKIILVVEDLQDMREFIVNSLPTKYRIIEANDGKSGIATAKEIIPDLIISDIMMPVMNGLELTKILKTDEKTSHIPIFLLTAKASEESKLEGLETGADSYITKPFNPKELQIRVKNIFELKDKMREQIKRNLFIKPKMEIIKSKDKLFVDKVLEIIELNIRESDFGVEELANKVFMSKSQLYRKTKALTDYSPVQLILNYRLKKAAELIEQDFGSISEIAFEVGFNNLGYFSQSFKKMYGVSPNKYNQI